MTVYRRWRLKSHGIGDIATTAPGGNEWQSMAVSAMVAELLDQQAHLTGCIIDNAGSAVVDDGIAEAREEARHHEVSHVSQTLHDLRHSKSIDLPILSVDMRYFRALIEE